MSDCIFCKIVAGEIPSMKIYEDDLTLAFLDVAKDVDGHILVIPKEHIASVAELSDDNRDIAARCLVAAGKIAAREGLAGGYRIVSNCGDDAGQTVKHLHFHILGGAKLPLHMGI